MVAPPQPHPRTFMAAGPSRQAYQAPTRSRHEHNPPIVSGSHRPSADQLASVPTAWAATAPHLTSSGRPAPEYKACAGSEVVAFLATLGLQQHATAFLQSGVDDMETLLALEESDLKDLGLPTYHRQRMHKRLSELQTEAVVDHEVTLFLQSAGLEQYTSILLRNGFDDMDTLLDVEDSDLRDLGMPRGHILRFRKRLQEHAKHQQAAASAQQGQGFAAAPVLAPALARRADPILAASARRVPSDEMKGVVRRSWERIEALGPVVVGDMLYRHVLALAPEAAALYPYEVRVKYLDWSSVDDESDIYNSQAMRRLFAKITNAVGSCVAGLADPAKMVPRLLELGSRHLHYGATEPHWEVVAEALQLTLRDALGAAYTADVHEAWRLMYGFISHLMIEGLRRARAAAAEVKAAAEAAEALCIKVKRVPSGGSWTTEAEAAESSASS